MPSALPVRRGFDIQAFDSFSLAVNFGVVKRIGRHDIYYLIYGDLFSKSRIFIILRAEMFEYFEAEALLNSYFVLNLLANRIAPCDTVASQGYDAAISRSSGISTGRSLWLGHVDR
jgi:hypothetical protein